MQYCETHLPSESTSKNTERLRLAIFSSLFDKCAKKLTVDEMTEVLIKCNAKPNKNKPKRKNQLFQVFKNIDNKLDFLNQLRKSDQFLRNNFLFKKGNIVLFRKKLLIFKVFPKSPSRPVSLLMRLWTLIFQHLPMSRYMQSH